MNDKIYLNISDIQHFSVGDGDGIRTTLFLKGCNLRCPWCHNPENISPLPEVLKFLNGEVTKGKLLQPCEVIEELLQDKDFYCESGGGVTVSGGEPMLQADALVELCKLLKTANVSVIVDTAGCVNFDAFEKLNGFVNEYYFDIKANCSEDYSQLNGNFDLIINNLKRLISSGEKVHVRIPLIPGFNTEKNYCEKICDILMQAGVKKVDLLPFHRLGKSKYVALERDYRYADVSPLTTEQINEIFKIYNKYFNVKVEK